MTIVHTSTIHNSRQCFYTGAMDSTADKEERKREYNRLAQREFRRRRKEHLKNLEQAQKEQSSEQSEEIERLRYQNEELRRENEALRTQLYGSAHGLLLQPAGQIPSDHRQYSLSPSVSGASISNAGSPPASLGSDMMSMSSMPMTSNMISPPTYAYTDSTALSSQPYNMVHQSGFRSHNSQGSPEISGYTRNPRAAMASSNFQHPSLNIPRAGDNGNATDRRSIASSSRQELVGHMDDTSYSWY
ncbi:hypothetical protein DSL72_003568 [Monilinia vaccinii-corymbosi]|uniref:BZIP domain-containing protein n=1 Tax=Monilinia vaccinii-corymbosi TaxID=61207 RepID=A0A8A3P642_9HELO|nr:hypothetical protein DSL72_003568 [Monilinia vaccinii-corymbosi]